VSAGAGGALHVSAQLITRQADFATVCADFHETAESVEAAKSGVTVLRPLLEDSAYKALVDAGKGVEPSTRSSPSRSPSVLHTSRRPR
jgi:hypothetical protein